MEPPNVASMEDYFRRQLLDAEFQRMRESSVPGQGDLISMSGMDDTQPSSMMGGDTLDDIVLQNQKEILRRRGMQPPYPRNVVRNEAGPRQTDMMDFGSGSDGDLNGYPFNPSPVPDGNAMAHNGRDTPTGARDQSRMRRSSAQDLSLDTQFARLGPEFGSMAQANSYQAALHSADAVPMNGNDAYNPTGLSAGLTNAMSLDFPPSGLGGVSSGNATPMNHFGAASLQQSMADSHYSPLHPDFTGTLHHGGERSDVPVSGNNAMDDAMNGNGMDQMPSLSLPEQISGPPIDNDGPDLSMQNNKPKLQETREQPNFQSAANAQGDAGAVASLRRDVSALTTSDNPAQARPVQGPEPLKQFKGVYSASGFDMLSVLMRVATRPNPEINIGAVDMSCAFVVCDVVSHDLPIIYCSDIFERLTGYTKHEILGRNCRFLQAPDGKVQSGVKRKYVDDDVVLHLKNKIMNRREAQTSLINYRKGGQPFMNLLTIIPITWDSDEVKYYVGFQVDLVETPQSVTNKNPDGSYAINYQRGFLPRYVWQTPENDRNQVELGQTIPRDEVSTVLSTISTGESELSKRIWDKVLLENTDDVVHVLSLKGLFLYLSPSSRKMLEYDSSELVGTALSSVCHPSDIVPVTRELKDTSTGAAVNVVFRIRRKHSGYTWFESHGSLHTEQGKGRKCIILVGRERPVYALSRNDIVAAGGIGENELWTKMSTSGMFLYVSSNVRTLLDRQPDDLIGTSVQALMRQESKREFGKVLETARTGKRASVTHEMQNKRGQVLQTHTTIYPGDATEGQKPTFLVAQTRLLKQSRNGSAVHSKMARADLGSTASTNTPNAGSSAGQAGSGAVPNQLSPHTFQQDCVITTPGGGGLPIGSQDVALASDENVFDELKTTRSTSWQFELRQMEKRNRLLAEELQSLLSSKKKRKRRKGAGQMQKDCANCHTRVTPEWRRGPSGSRDLCNSCGLRWAKQNGRVSPRTNSQQSASPAHSSPRPGDVLNNNASSSMPPPDRTVSGEVTDSARKATAASHAAQGQTTDGSGQSEGQG